MNVKKYIAAVFVVALCFVLGAYKKAPEGQADVAKEVKLSVLPGLLFDVPRFHVTPGQTVRIEFTNNDDMDHNLLILQPGSRKQVVDLATELAADGMDRGYIPESPAVLWHTDVLHAGEVAQLTFTAPKEEGVYPYVCTLPGHGNVMYGAMYVTAENDMPPLAADTEVPQGQRKDEQHHHHRVRNHPYELKPPYHYRLYVEGASPAAIAVHLPGQLSYCWDAARCDLRFMWEGGFVDQTELWKGHKDAKAEVIGNIFYTQSVLPSISLSDDEAQPRSFKGYRLQDDGYLEFQYQIGQWTVWETLRENPDQRGIIRSFRIPDLTDPLQIHLAASTTATISYQGKELTSDKLILDGPEGQSFDLRYTFNKL